MNLKRILWTAAGVLIATALVWYGIQELASRKREIGYVNALNAYSQALHPGMTRKDVERYLRSRNTKFTWIFTAFGGRPESQTADLVKIGEEDGLWVCNKEAYVYVAFEFVFTRIEDVHRQLNSDNFSGLNYFN